jgi:predicted enzyme related to lactoylglutathione lyase
MSKMTSYTPGQFSWVDLLTPDTRGASKFYGELFGWTFEDIGNDYNEIKLGDGSNGGIRTIGADEPDMPSAWLAYIAVADCDATVERLKALGGSAMMEPVDIEPGRFCLVSDPQGGVLTVIRLNASD